MTSLADRFRHWYEYERDCNAKTLAMLSSVPAERRTEADFQKALGKMAHLIAARQRWLHRLGHWAQMPAIFPKDATLDSLATQVAETESAWVAYLSKLDDAELAREFEYKAWDDKKYRWTVEGLLTQVFGHAWYHRGQIASLVAGLGGKAVDTDYVFWSKLTPIE
jgi:uncharacterized damage-inducible protein DinB